MDSDNTTRLRPLPKIEVAPSEPPMPRFPGLRIQPAAPAPALPVIDNAPKTAQAAPVPQPTPTPQPPLPQIPQPIPPQPAVPQQTAAEPASQAPLQTPEAPKPEPRPVVPPKSTSPAPIPQPLQTPQQQAELEDDDDDGTDEEMLDGSDLLDDDGDDGQDSDIPGDDGANAPKGLPWKWIALVCLVLLLALAAFAWWHHSCAQAENQAKINSLSLRLTTLTTNLKERQEELDQALEKQETLQKTIADLENERQRLRDEQEAAKKKILELEEQALQLERGMEYLLQEKENECKDGICQENPLDALMRAYEDVMEKLTEALNENERIKKEDIAALQKEIDSVSRERDAVQAKLDECTSRFVVSEPEPAQTSTPCCG